MSAPSEILIRITSSYGLRIKAEIPRMYDEARVLAPETARLWQDLLSVDIERADMVLVIDRLRPKYRYSLCDPRKS
jgi:hypothetical protein